MRANGGACGADEVSLEDFAADLERRLAQLAGQLAAGRYRPGPLRRAAIRKPGGGKRFLAIPTVRDRVAQSAAASWLTARLDGRMSEASFAYRPGRSVDLAVAALERAWRGGDVWTMDADIRRFFDRTPHRRLLSELRGWVGDEPRLLAVVRLWLRGFGRFGRGLAQGSPISPVLANLYLDPFDRAFEACGLPLVRYADDFVVMAASEAEAREARRLAADLLTARGLRLHGAKTAIRAPGEAFVFLGRTVWAPCR